MAIKHSITLSTTEPNNEVGVIKIRQADEQTQTLEVQITENGVPKSYQGLAVYFCAKLGQTAGLGIIEQKLKLEEMTSPANGKLEYTMRAEDWQILGRQRGYFSFRLMLDEHEFIDQFTTRDFTFEVIKSVFSEGVKEVKKDGSTYVWTIEDLIRLFNEYMASGKSDWEEFVEQNRDVLESVDPGGKLIGELIEARKPFGEEAYSTLGKRLDNFDANLAQAMILVKQTDNLQDIVNNAPINSTLIFPRGGEFNLAVDVIMRGDLTLDGNGCRFKGPGRLRFYDVSNIKITGFYFKGDSSVDVIYTPVLFNPSPEFCGKNTNIAVYNNVFDGCELWLKSYDSMHSNNNISIYDNQFIGNQSFKIADGMGCVLLANCKNGRVYNNYFDTNGAYRHIKIMAAIGVEKNVNVNGVLHHTIIDDGFSENIEILNNKFYGTLRKTRTSTYAKQVIDLFNGASDILIKDNMIKVNVDSVVPLEHAIDGKEYGPQPFECYTNKVRNITIENNHIEGNFYNAIFLGNLYGQIAIKDTNGNTYTDDESYVTIKNNKIITTTKDMRYPTELIKVSGHKVVNVTNNLLQMDSSMTGLIKAIWVLSSGYIVVAGNNILNQGRIYIDEPYPIQGIYGREGAKRFNCIIDIKITDNTVEWLGVRAIVFGTINTFETIGNNDIITTLTIKNNFFNNLDTGSIALPFGTNGRFKKMLITGNSYVTRSGGTLTYPNYTNMSIADVEDVDNAWSKIAALPTSGTFNKGQLLQKSDVTAGDVIGWICTQRGTFGSLNGNRTYGSTTLNSNKVSVTSIVGLAVGQYVQIAGVNGVKRIIAIDASNNVVTLDINCDAAVISAQVLYSQPIFKKYGAVES